MADDSFVPHDWAWLLSGLPIARRRFTLRATRTFQLPRFPGNMLRGALGYALAALEEASYEEVFRPTRQRERSDRAARDDVPPPYVVEWSPRRDSSVAAGQRWSFDLVVFGAVGEQLDPIVAGVEAAAARGLGIERVPHRLVEVIDPLDSKGATTLDQIPDLLPRSRLDELCLEAVTPLRLGKKHVPVDRLTFVDLFQAMQRRARMLARFHGQVDVPPRREELNILARAVKLEPRSLRWLPLERGSSRQGQRIAVDGMLGTFRLRGPLEAFRPLLRSVLTLHVGKYSTLGHGRIGLDQREQRSP